MAASKTMRMARSILTPDFAMKLLGRLRHPSRLAADIARLRQELRRDFIRSYASYHQRRQTPGRVFWISKRGYRMWLPIAWGETVAQRRFGQFEPETFDTLQRIVTPGSVVVELGACYGEFTIHLSRLVGPSGRVVSFEPMPRYFEIAKRNIELNGLKNVQLFNMAAGAPGTPELRLDPDASDPYEFIGQISGLDYGKARGAKAREASSLPTSIPCVPLRQFMVEQHVAPDLIFMDIEGSEVQVIADLEPLLRGAEKRPAVYFELHPGFYKPGDQARLEAIFRDCDYLTERVGGHLLCTPANSRGRQS